jgi:predicted extracellular nuclease
MESMTPSTVREKRRAQAEYLARLIQERMTAAPTEPLLVLGDFNAFEFNDGFVDVIGTITGRPAPPDQVVLASPDLVEPDLTDLALTLPPDQRYSYVLDGNAQVLDHILASRHRRAGLPTTISPSCTSPRHLVPF